MPLDYSKFDKIEDSDEEDYDEYLRRTYGVTSGWRPGCGMQPPVLGGRTPGKVYEDHEMTPIDLTPKGEGEAPDESTAEATAPSAGEPPVVQQGLGNAGRWLLASMRLLELSVWLMPIVIVFYLMVAGAEEGLRLESIVYPSLMMVSTIMGFFDAGMASMLHTRAEGPASVAFACWFKRAFISLTFLAYEAQFASPPISVLGVMSLQLMAGLTMASMWILRKAWGYGKDLIVLAFHPELLGMNFGEQERKTYSPASVPGGRSLLIVEGLAELIFVVVHLIVLPPGTRFLGIQQPAAIWFSTLSVLGLANMVALRRARVASEKIAKDEHAD